MQARTKAQVDGLVKDMKDFEKEGKKQEVLEARKEAVLRELVKAAPDALSKNKIGNLIGKNGRIINKIIAVLLQGEKIEKA